jgi:uncharacterized protein (DUF433 family)
MKNTIVIDPKILAGKPVVRGTRISVSLILNLLVRGYTPARIIQAYPNLKRSDIIAAIEYSKVRLDRERITTLQFAR